MKIQSSISKEKMKEELKKLADRWHITEEFLLRKIIQEFRKNTVEQIKDNCEILDIKINGKNINESMKIFIWIKGFNFVQNGFKKSLIKALQSEYKKENTVRERKILNIQKIAV